MSLTVEQAYDNIEKAILYGFLTVGVSYGSDYFILKNITDKEYKNLELYRPDGDVYTDILYHIAFCTMFVNSMNFLENRFEQIPQLVKFFSGMPIVFISKIKDTLQKLNQEYLDSLSFLEGFCYTDKSRYLWKVFDVSDRDNYVGIEGLNNVGLNSVQENWVVVNKRLDEEEEYQKDFNLSILIASATNPKGTKVISRNYDFHRQELEELRKDIAKYGYDKKRVKEQQRQAEWTAPLKSREDLVRELYRQMAGKKDRHDLFIDEWVKQQRAMAEEAKRQAENKQQEFRSKLKNVELEEIEGSRPVSTAELSKILTKNGTIKRDAPVSEYMSAFENLDTKERFLKKVSATIIRPKDKG